MIATYTWNQGTSGVWSTGSNWTNVNSGIAGTAPTSNDSATIAASGTYTISFSRSATSQAVGSLSLNGVNATLNIGGGRTLAVAGGVQLSNGTLDAFGLLTDSSLTQSGGTLAASGTVISSGAVDLNGGIASVTAGAFTVASGGIAIGTAGDLAISGGAVTVASGGLGVGASGILSVAGGAGTIAGGATLSGGDATFTSGSFFLTSGGLVATSGGTIVVNGGAVTTTGDTDLVGSSQTVSSGSYYGFTGALSLSSNSTLAVTGGTDTFDNSSTFDASTETISGGTLYVDAGNLLMTDGNTLAVTGGNVVTAQATTLSASAELVSAGTFFVFSDGFTVGNGGSIATTGGLVAARGGAILASGGTVLVSGGTFAVQSGSLSIASLASFIATGGTAVIANGAILSGGTLALSGAAAFSSNTLSINSGVFSETGAVAVTVTQAATFGTSQTISAGSFNAGTVLVTGAATTLALNSGTVTSSGTVGGVSIGSGAAIALGASAATLDATLGGIALSGNLTGLGVVHGAIAGTGTVLASGGVLDLTSGVSAASVSFLIGNSAPSVLRLDGAASGNPTFQFSGTSGVLELNDVSPTSINFAGTVAELSVSASNAPNLATQNYINVQAVVTQATLVSNTAIELYNGATDLGTINLAASASGEFVNYGSDTSFTGSSIGSGTDIFLSAVVCFAAGTRILTEAGEVSVESLAEGDSVITVTDGVRRARPVRWIGHRRVDLAAHPRPELVAPIRVRRDAFGPGQPRRDLMLSPDHSVFIDGTLVPIKLLLNGLTISQEREARAVTYFHVELDEHAILLAENLPAESYLDTGNRSFFANAGTISMLHPELALDVPSPDREAGSCVPITRSREQLLPIWRALNARARLLGWCAEPVAMTTVPDVRLVVAGRLIRPVSETDQRIVFVVGPGLEPIRLVSRSGVPADDTPCLDELRRLGVAVQRMTVTGDGALIDIPLDHPGLRRGWHDLEHDSTTNWRWTNGDAELPVSRAGGAVVLEVGLCGSMRYRLPTVVQPERVGAAPAGAAWPGEGHDRDVARAASRRF